MKNLFAGAALIVIFFFLVIVSVHLHPLGKPSVRDMDDYFLGGKQEVCDSRCSSEMQVYNNSKGQTCCEIGYGSQEELGVNNVVTAVVFDYRGFDTLGEATVLFAAITSVFMVFWGRLK